MPNNTIDARGLRCPQPLMLTKKALTKLSAGDSLRVLIDNETSKNNLLRFLQDHGVTPEVTRAEEVYTLQLKIPAEMPQTGEAASYCAEQKPAGGAVIVINNRGMGSGSDELGAILLQACVNTLKEVSPLPAAILCYNGGVFVTKEGAPTIPALTELVKKGVTLLVCGTCIDYFELQNQVAVGTISNMYDILQQLSTAERIITL